MVEVHHWRLQLIQIITCSLKEPGLIASDFFQIFWDSGIRRKLIFFSLPLVTFTAEKLFHLEDINENMTSFYITIINTYVTRGPMEPTSVFCVFTTFACNFYHHHFFYCHAHDCAKKSWCQILLKFALEKVFFSIFVVLCNHTERKSVKWLPFWNGTIFKTFLTDNHNLTYSINGVIFIRKFHWESGFLRLGP